MRVQIILFGLVGAFLLSGCETMKGSMRDISSWGKSTSSSTGNMNQSADVRMREDTGAGVTPMPAMSYQSEPMASGYQGYTDYNSHSVMANENVALYDTETRMEYNRNNYSTGATLPSYSGGMASPHDSSVTIYSVDGSPMMAQAPAQDYGYDQQYEPQYYPGGYASGYMNGPTGNQIYFQHGSSRLGSGDMRKLDSLADQAKFAPVNRVTVAGYASKPTQAGSDTVESHVLNLKESMNRSFAVSKTLMQKGVPAEKIKAVSWGATKPTGNPQQDRRVDVIMGEQ